MDHDFNNLWGKFVTRRINRISPPINEFNRSYQPKNNRSRAGRENELRVFASLADAKALLD